MPETKSHRHPKHEGRRKSERDERGRSDDRKNGSGKRHGHSIPPDRPKDPSAKPPPGRPPPKKDDTFVGSGNDVETYQNTDNYRIYPSTNQDGQSYSSPMVETIEILINSHRLSAVVDRNVEESFISSNSTKEWKLKPKLASKPRGYKGFSTEQRVKVQVGLPKGKPVKEHPLYVLHEFEGVVIGNELATELNLPTYPSAYDSYNNTSTQSHDTASTENISGQMNSLSIHTPNSNSQRTLEYEAERQPQDATSKYSGYSNQYPYRSPGSLADSGIGMNSTGNGGSGIEFSSYGLQNTYSPQAPYSSHTSPAPSSSAGHISYPSSVLSNSPEISSTSTISNRSTISSPQDNYGYYYPKPTPYYSDADITH